MIDEFMHFGYFWSWISRNVAASFGSKLLPQSPKIEFVSCFFCCFWRWHRIDSNTNSVVVMHDFNSIKLTRKVFFGWRTCLCHASSRTHSLTHTFEMPIKSNQIELDWFWFEYLSIICHKVYNHLTSVMPSRSLVFSFLSLTLHLMATLAHKKLL